ncbi:MAG: efflux RND transporter periplasmic adaptor subunit [Candidatus Solibacter usitatus]|nr:efflux RND transporter periplasmic adaptor subunit [Candidatus Solibacter usitatus]
MFLASLALTGCGAKEQRASANTNVTPNGLTREADGTIVLPADSPKLQQIRVDAVKLGEVPVGEVVSPGKIEVNPNKVSRVVLPVPGRVSSVLVKLGDAVERGQPVLTLESPDADAAHSAYLQAMAAIVQSKSALGKAQADYERSSDLFAHNAAARKDVLAAEAAVVQCKAALDQAQATREQTERRLTLLGLKPGEFGQKITVAAPMSGKVLELLVAQGEYRNDTSAPLITIADLGTVWVAADVPETALRFIRVGERVDITLAAFPGEAFHGRVMRIADTVDPQTRTIKVRAEMENPQGRFRPEMFGSIRHTEGLRSMPLLPVGAVVQGEGHSSVFVEQAPGRFRQTEIALDQRNGNTVAVASGVKEGDRVVVDGAMLLRTQ